MTPDRVGDHTISNAASILQRFAVTDQVAIVTGASSGLGRHAARMLHDAGATVHFVARRADRLIAATAGLERAYAEVCDITEPDQVADLVHRVTSQHGKIDILVNCAGSSNIVPAEEERLEDFENVLKINLVAAYSLCQRVGLHMLERESGSVINVSSIMGLVGSGRVPQAGYAASKAGLVNMSRELAIQWARRGVRVNALAPGWFETELTTGLFSHERGAEWVRRTTPMGRPGMLDELDGAILFLASSVSSFVTGQVLVVDGGWTAQ
jgi:NAD(P)-dependent dehydrogenase (short-subunit alcohol dehydrogenase family)